jgi:deazaflavin-dependent oxidoreductase (nitroreductase family)
VNQIVTLNLLAAHGTRGAGCTMPGTALPRYPAAMVARRSSALYWIIGRFGTSRMVSRLHPRVYRLTGGRGIVGRSMGMRHVVVTTVGRRSGIVREIPLYATDDGPRLLLVGSYAGRDRDPAWVGNLAAHPEADVLVGREVRRMRARLAEGEERERAWALAVDAYPGYAAYQRWTRRRIPVVVLEPADGIDGAARDEEGAA